MTYTETGPIRIEEDEAAAAEGHKTLKGFNQTLDQQGVNVVNQAQGLRFLIGLEGLEGFDQVADEDLMTVLRERETLGIIKSLHGKLTSIGEMQDQALAGQDTNIYRKFVNIYSFIGTVMEGLIKEKPPLGDDLMFGYGDSERFYEASVIQTLITMVLKPGYSLPTIHARPDQKLIIDQDRAWAIDERAQKAYKRETGMEMSNDWGKAAEFSMKKMAGKDSGWWRAMTEKEERVIVDYLRSRAKATIHEWEILIDVTARLTRNDKKIYSRKQMKILKAKLAELKSLRRGVTKAKDLDEVLALCDFKSILSALQPNYYEIGKLTDQLLDEDPGLTV